MGALMRVATSLRFMSDGSDHPPDHRTASLVGGDGLEPPTLSV
jgi:hypothetical protein